MVQIGKQMQPLPRLTIRLCPRRRPPRHSLAIHRTRECASSRETKCCMAPRMPGEQHPDLKTNLIVKRSKIDPEIERARKSGPKTGRMRNSTRLLSGSSKSTAKASPRHTKRAWNGRRKWKVSDEMMPPCFESRLRPPEARPSQQSILIFF